MRTNKQIKAVLDRAAPFAKTFKSWAPSDSVMARYNPHIKAQGSDGDETTLNIYSSIGEYFDWWTGETSGIGANTVSAFLDKADGRDVTININSPGGDYFEGLAIYNLLDQYDGNVKVRVIGLAASAASFLAMGGDTIEIAKAGFFMIHNASTGVYGNKEMMRDAADVLAQLDEVMAGIYVDRTGKSAKDIAKMLDAETWISGEDAVDMGFADGFLGKDATVEETNESGNTSAVKRLEKALARAGLTRQERQDLKAEFLRDAIQANARKTATPTAGDFPTPTAGHDQKAFLAALEGLRDVVTT